MKYLNFKPPKKAVFVARNQSLGIIKKQNSIEGCRSHQACLK